MKFLSGPWFNIKMSSYQYRKSHCGDKTVVRSSYLHNGISYTGKMTSLYWFSPLVNMFDDESTLLQVMAWRHQATSHTWSHLTQISLAIYGHWATMSLPGWHWGWIIPELLPLLLMPWDLILAKVVSRHSICISNAGYTGPCFPQWFQHPVSI